MQHLSLLPPYQNVRRLLWVRGLFLLCVLSALAVAHWLLELQLNYQALLLVITIMSFINVMTWFRVRRTRALGNGEFLFQLVLDVLGVTLLLFYSGGASSPFVSFYLVPICISSATLGWRNSVVLTLISLLAYSTLFFYYVPVAEISPQHHHHAGTMNLHSVGMWINFLLSASLITYFVVRMAEAIKKQSEEVSQLREEMVRDGQLFSLAALAAGTAHELGTPLSTMKTLAREMQFDCKEHPEVLHDISLLNQQIDHCSSILSRLHERAEHRDGNSEVQNSSDQYCREVVEQWLVMRPDVRVKIDISTESPVPVSFVPAVDQAIVNVFNNAADACRSEVGICCSWDDKHLIIKVLDDGPGIPNELISEIDQAYRSSKGKGRGLGLFLTQTTLSRYGGSLNFKPREPRGTETELILPIHRQTHV